MKKDELIQGLTDLGVKPKDYSLDGPNIEGIMLDITINYYEDNKSYNEWRVFEQERGYRWNEKVFYKEEEAFKDIYNRFKKNPA